MLREILKSKIHRATITKTELNYEGSIGIDKALLEKSDIFPGEKVQILNFNNGQRFETYVIEERKNSGIIALYGPAARLGQIGDEVAILSYTLIDNEGLKRLKQKVVFVDKDNRLI